MLIYLIIKSRTWEGSPQQIRIITALYKSRCANKQGKGRPGASIPLGDLEPRKKLTCPTDIQTDTRHSAGGTRDAGLTTMGLIKSYGPDCLFLFPLIPSLRIKLSGFWASG